MANELKLENELSKDRKPVKINDSSTGLLLANNEVYIENDANVGGDLTVQGSIKAETGQNILDGTTQIRTAESHEIGIYLIPNGTISIGEPAAASPGKVAKLGIGLANQSVLNLFSREDEGDLFAITTTTNGATTINTTDDDGTNASIEISADGSVILNSANGRYKMKNAGTEFSVSSSAFAGMILGYTTVGIDASDDSYTLTSTMTVPDNALRVSFVAPPSGVVEIFAQIYFDAARRAPVLGLSDQNATDGYRAISFPNATDVTNEHIQAVPPSASGDTVLRPHWVVTGLTAGTAYEWWLGAKTSLGTGGVLKWGGVATNKYPPFIMKATALPTATANYAVYG